MSPVSGFYGCSSCAAAAQLGLMVENNPSDYINTEINLEMTRDS